MELFLRTLSPVHIGTGEELAPLDYVVLNQRFYRLSQDQFFDLVRRLLPETGFRDLGDWISAQYREMREERDNRELSRMNEGMNVYAFFKQKGKDREFIQALPGVAGAGQPVILDDRTRSRHRDAAVVSLGQIRGMIKTGAGQQSYIPGSSLKGSLRTALFFDYLTHAPEKGLIEKLLLEQLNDRQVRKEQFGAPLIHEAFFCGMQDAKGRYYKDDEKMDLFKLVRFSDAHLANTPQDIHLAKMNLYLVEKEDVQRSRSAQASFKAVQQPQASYCEVIPSGHILKTELAFDIDFLLQAKQFLRGDGIPSGGATQWIGLEKKVAQLFGIQMAELNKDNKEQKRQEVLQHLLGCWNVFSAKQVESQRKWLEHFSAHDSQNQWSSKIEAGMERVMDKNPSCRLAHLGYATGFNGMTAILYFLEDIRLSNLYKRILETFNIGNKPGNKGAYKVNMQRFPKSRRLLDMGATIAPLGWLEVAEHPDQFKQALGSKSKVQNAPATPPPKAPVEPAYFTGQFNFKKPPELDAVVIESGRPNKVQVYVRNDYMPILALSGYATPLEKGTVIIVRSVINKKNEVVQVSFGRKK